MLTRKQRAVAKMLVNSNQIGSIYYGGTFSGSSTAKHDLYWDFGYPRAGELTFQQHYYMYRRNGLAAALVRKTVGTTWQEMPCLQEQEEADGKETALEREIRQHFDRIRFWQSLSEADMRSMVGKYAGVILQLGDGGQYRDPVDAVPGGIEGVVSVLPAWEGQLEPSDWISDPSSPDYGKPSMFRFNESSVDAETGQYRSFQVHPDRVIVWSRDGTTFGESRLEACHNALMDLEKIRGAGAEGFWKNAKAQPVLTASEDVDFTQLAAMLGTDVAGLPDALDEVVAKWSKGFDESLLLQQIEAKTLSVQLPSQPEQYAQLALQEVAASWPIPQKMLIGMQTGERASTEDARQWAAWNMSRRNNICIPNIMDMVNRFERWGILPERDWYVSWADLTAPTIAEKLEISERMAKVNQAMAALGGEVFTDDEIREVAGYDAIALDPLTEFDGAEPDSPETPE